MLESKKEQLVLTFEEVDVVMEMESVEIPKLDFVNADLNNISWMLPTLYDHQQKDIYKIEKRYLEGKGYLITNGTGVGKTYVGLGLIKRFWNNNKRNTIVVVPTDKKAQDWIKDGLNLDLSIYKLNGINDSGFDIRVTTYANFYQNEEVAKIDFDLVIYDESHYLNQNASGAGTSALSMHRVVSNLPSEAKMKALKYISKRPVYDDNTVHDLKEHHRLLSCWKADRLKKTIELNEMTKVLFLSATPFAYHKSITYADGCLFDIEESIVEDENINYGYNEARGFGKFLCENFGYTMEYNRITRPGPEVNTDLLERNFFESQCEKGVMSTRVLELDYDYSREFITLESEIGQILDEGMKIFHDTDTKKKYPNLAELSTRKWNYNNLNQLIECIKARECVSRIHDHLSLHRKVVIFHTYNHSKIPHPFRFESDDLLKTGERYLMTTVDREIEQFEEEFHYYVDLDLSDLMNPREAITSVFPHAKEFNGTVNKKKRSSYIDDFNEDYSSTDIIIVQTKAGREGISLHDIFGTRPRAIINLGLPTAPTQAIQEEGRIYRSGLLSNAVYEYMTLQTDFERHAFANKIAERSKTAENLAMGNLARDLERAFKDGYIDSTIEKPNMFQGTGGKDSDRALLTITPYEKSITYYYMRQKKNARNKAKEGIDYFATPEPLGFKMCEWVKNNNEKTFVNRADKWLEPSSGHGAIARFFPLNTSNVFIEPSSFLSSQLAINSKGDVKQVRFEDYHKMNKFTYIVMNPPFGKGGSTAIEHLEKACDQLERKNATLLCILPYGPAANKKFDAFINDEIRFKFLKFTGEIILPNVTFERAGTKVYTRIVRIQKNVFDDTNVQFNHQDFSHITDAKEFFEAIKELDF
jgi:hypothetical protein